MKYYHKEHIGVEEKVQPTIKIPEFKNIVDFLTPEEEKEVDDWDELNSKALGSIRLHLHYLIQYEYKEIETAKGLWEAIALEYGKPGLSSVYVKLWAAMETTIPSDFDPSLAIDKFIVHFG